MCRMFNLQEASFKQVQCPAGACTETEPCNMCALFSFSHFFYCKTSFCILTLLLSVHMMGLLLLMFPKWPHAEENQELFPVLTSCSCINRSPCHLCPSVQTLHTHAAWSEALIRYLSQFLLSRGVWLKTRLLFFCGDHCQEFSQAEKNT